jgi:hypothetical protein
MKILRDIVGVVLLLAGVGGIMTGVRGVSGDSWWGGPALGAGAVANVLAYRVMRPAAKRAEEPTSDHAEPRA